MNVRAQHFCRGYRAQKTLSLLLKRSVATEEVGATPKIAPLRADSESRGLKPVALQREGTKIPKVAKKSATVLHKKQVSHVHPALAEGYEVGGHLKKGDEPFKRHDEKGLPMWGEWGIPIKFLSWAGLHTSSMPSFWLRDNCRCEKCVNQDTMQRAFDTFSLPKDVMPREVVTEKEGLRVTWAHDGHVSIYPWEWLRENRARPSLNDDIEKDRLAAINPYTYWGSEIKANPPSVHYDEIMADDKGVGKWTAKIRQFGFCYVNGCPIDPKKTKELLERISFIRITHYGGFYDFTSDLTMKDTAYTNLALPAHTDTTYFTDPAGLQMFHLLSHTSGEGGDSLLVDGFHAARILKQEHRYSYYVLSETPIKWHASGNEGITITPATKYPVFNFTASRAGETPKLMQVRWNNDDRGTISPWEKKAITAENWYAAARRFNDILKRENMAYWAKYEPGRPVIFDNWRVLHGRSAFTGKRRMCGGYINHDDYVSRWRNTNYTREEALSQIL